MGSAKPQHSLDDEGPASSPPARRLVDQIQTAFNDACEQDLLELAALLLVEYENVVTRVPISLGGGRRSEIEQLISAHGRLWELLRSSDSK